MTTGSTSDVVFEYDKSVIGTELDVGTAEITAARIAAYCAAVGETNPLYTDATAAEAGPYGGLVAPPAILQTLGSGGGPDPKVKFGNTAFHSGTRFEVYAPLRPGDTITVKAGVKEVYAKTGRTGTMVFAVRTQRFVNQDGTTVALTEQSMVHRDTTSNA